ncbi:hypothetical protein [Flavobacterium pectinovorum]|uniref:Leucine-rich repeat domain-containing protein n=1 Tax=Flavobacterium pectinovorum TaxID=29533 RepID=A0A502EZ50_9FLAO|nr:hypothetical protein [Flavobacterium pectinovorum]TPG41969.1 hypothetical protein EAH81_06505 [Flavobacterium pectinovorum]
MKENIEKIPNKTESSTHTYTINNALKLNTINEGEPTDNVLVYGTDNEVKSIRRSEFEIGLIKIKGEYSNNDEALLNGLVDGDIYNLPLNLSQNNVALLAVVKDISLAILTLTWANIDTDISSFGISDKYDLVQWKNYFSSRLSSGVLYSLDVTENTIRFKFQNSVSINQVNLWNMRLMDIELENFEQLDYLGLDNNNLTSFNPSIPLPGTLTHLGLSGNQLTDFSPTLPLPYSLQTLEIRNNQLVNFSPKLPSGLSTLWLDSNNLEEFAIINSLPSNLRFIELAYNKLSNFDPTIPWPEYFENLGLMGNNLTSFNPTLPLPNSLYFLNLSGNKLTSFNPVLPLPTSLREIYMSTNLITTSSWNNDTAWISSLANNGVINVMSNTGKVSGTATEALLLAKSWTIQVY